MDYDDNDEDYLPPPHACLFRSPKEPNLQAEYDLYRTSIGVRRLFSERNREVYSEAFIENDRTGTLINLCIEAVAKLGSIKNIPALIRDDPLKMRLYYDSLDVDLPLRQCYIVNDILYWRRVVLSKSSNKSLRLKKWNDYDWKSKGVSIKYVELVESCPAEFWPEKEMAELAAYVKGHVKSMHIRRLQPLPETAFSQYVESDSEVDVTSSSSDFETISSDELDTEEDEVEEEEIIENISQKSGKESIRKSKISVQKSNESIRKSKESFPKSKESFPKSKESFPKSKESIQRNNRDTRFYGSLDMMNQRAREFSISDINSQQIDRRNARHDRNAARQQLRNIQAKRKAEKERRLQRRELTRNQLASPKKNTEKKSKKKKKKIKSVFDIQVDAEPSDGENKIPDKRNKERILRHMSRFDYSSEYCHHIDLSFVRHFDNLVSFHLEFLGPTGSVHDYHKRYIRFSFDDMSRLGKGLKTLEHLKIFRLRNSRLDRNQMHVLSRALKTLNMLEEVDFGYDDMDDDCCVALETLLGREKMLKVLQLEYNKLGKASMDAVVFALGEYDGTETLDYLGLAHNPITGLGLSCLCRCLVDTNHVERLNIAAIEVSKEVVANEVSRLLRQHNRLRYLEMSSIPLDPLFGNLILRALETNKDILYIDCRCCDLGLDAEFEIDILIRRNKFLVKNSYVGGTLTSEKDICKFLTDSKHPIMAKVEQEQKKKNDCIRNRIHHQSTVKSSITGTPESKRDTEEYDIWTVLGVKAQLQRFSKNKPENKPAVKPSLAKQVPFVYNPNSFNMEQFREYVYQPGPSNRYYYIKSKKDS